ncbi:hypothetical protein CRG98_003085 [Punica granatum]|uniref:Uncharacterized protein n=1 Tax=Punica granatum TaxID=22663 RepID=A0A2I0L748_PUNGR|nr:hypothetical protein CRG98_003085 [Punica granatum]
MAIEMLRGRSGPTPPLLRLRLPEGNASRCLPMEQPPASCHGHLSSTTALDLWLKKRAGQPTHERHAKAAAPD